MFPIRALASLALAFASLAQAAPGQLDTTFADNGVLRGAIAGPTTDRATAVAVQPDGRILLAGTASNSAINSIGLVRLNADGSRDASFPTVTYAGEPGNYNNSVSAIAVQPDGRIVLAGWTASGAADSNAFLVLRFNADGTPDTTFNGSGVATVKMGTSFSKATALALQPDGKIIVVGHAYQGAVASYDFAVVRYNANGTLDTTFSGNGKVVTDLSAGDDRATGVALQADGRIVVVGTSTQPMPTGARVAVVRYDTNGSLDTTFNGSSNNIFTILGDGFDEGRAVAIQPNGRIVIAGTTKSDPYVFAPYSLGIARLTTAGVLDGTFSGNGKLATALPSGSGTSKAVAIDPQGRIVVCAMLDDLGDSLHVYTSALVRYHTNGDLDLSLGEGGVMLFGEGQYDYAGDGFVAYDGSFLVTQDFVSDLAVTRRLSSGLPDPGFGIGGTVRVNVDSPDRPGQWDAIAALPGGQIAVAGKTVIQAGMYVAARYESDGTADDGYGAAGVAIPSLGNVDGVATRGQAIRSDGTVAFTGLRFLDNVTTAGSFKLAPNGKLDTSFSSDGRVSTELGSFYEPNAVAVLPDGGLLVAGSGVDYIPQKTFLAVKYRADGSLDTAFGTGGIAMHEVFLDDALAKAVAIQPDGKIVIAGKVRVSSRFVFAIMRLLPDGTLDNTFSSNGYVLSSVGGDDHDLRAMILQDDGKILLAGGLHNGTTGYDFVVARYTAAGVLDPTFNGNGRIVSVFGANRSMLEALAIQADGKIVAVGTSPPGFVDTTLALARYNTNGTLDAAFGTAGQSTMGFPGRVLVASSVAIAPDGKILVGGGIGDSTSRAAVFRIQSEATPAAVTFTTQLNATASSTRTSNSVTVSGVTGSIPISIADGSYSIGCTATFTTLPATIANGATVCVRHQASPFPGTSTVTALYLGGRTVTFTSITAKAASTTTLASSANPSPVQTTVTFTATVGGLFATPSGTVTFRDGALVLGTAPVGATGKALLVATGLVLGSHAITASFGGDSTYNASTSGALTQVVAGSALTVSAATSNASVPYGTTVTFTATLSIAPPSSAIVFFYDNGNFLGADTTTGTTATFATRSLVAGAHAITAEFVGAGNYGASTSPAITQTVVPAPSATVLASDSATGNLGSPVTFTAAVASAGNALAGSVAFTRGGIPLAGCAAVPVLASWTARCVVANLPVGSTTLVAKYSGDGNNLASDSSALVQPVTYDPAADADNDGIPNGVEFAELRDPLVKDNELFTSARWFAMQQYRDFLGREGEAAGIAFYTDQLMAGTSARANVIENFFGSPEFSGTASPIARLYFAAFLRAPDYEGLLFQVDASRTGASLAAIANNFTLSGEFQQKYGALDDAQYVSLLYANILGRTPSGNEIDYHVARLASGLTRGEVLVGFSESPEYQAAVGNEVYVTMMYVGMLRRAPDAGGLAYWVGYMDAGNPGLALILGFLNAPEYRNRFLP